ncbi:hypothetical protein [Microvirga massiliensis]|uniref:hypothetical protein n=1 Tax=Microvirga massiliensis TaxID=1033741 RepID=UPI00062BE055|nr:hypothetical protein [Microvirga massiliensis]
MQLNTFESLANKQGLVLMQVVDSFAPYDEGALAGFPPDEALRLFQRKVAVPVGKDGRPVDVPADTPERSNIPAASSSVEIPENWRSLHHLQRVRIAKDLVGGARVISSVAEADLIIQGELERRGNEDDEDEE